MYVRLVFEITKCVLVRSRAIRNYFLARAALGGPAPFLRLRGCDRVVVHVLVILAFPTTLSSFCSDTSFIFFVVTRLDLIGLPFAVFELLLDGYKPQNVATSLRGVDFGGSGQLNLGARKDLNHNS